MAILQRTLTTGSIWIGSGSSTTQWSTYNTDHNVPFAIYVGGQKRLAYENQSATASSLLLTTHSAIGSREFESGFGGQGFKIEPLSLSEYPFSNSWRGTFDELWVRGTMNVYEFVINQIRATNGSLWVSDAGKVTSASYADHKLALTFYTDSAGYVMPFVPGDIIRSKRWMPHGTNSIQTNWDFMGIVQASEYGSGKCSLDVSSGNYYLAPESYTLQTFVKDVASYGAEFVRIGNTSTASRKGAIYLTSNDQGGPFLDVYDGVSSIGNFTGSFTGSNERQTTSVIPNTYSGQSADDRRLKLRLGQLNGITTDEFGGQLSGYGLYADNAYLRGWIHANKGGQIAGWTITNSYLSSGDISIATSIDADDNTYRGIFIKNPEASWDHLSYGNSAFPLYIGQHSKSGGGWQPVRISLGDALRFYNGSLYISGTVSAVAGDIANWSIDTNTLYSGDVTISSLATNKYFGIGSADYNTDGIYIGSNSVGGRQLSLKNNSTGLFWDGANLGISTSKFTLSQGNITAQGGSIAGWTIADTYLNKSYDNAELKFTTETTSAWQYVNSAGYVFDISGSTNPLINIRAAYAGASGSEVGDKGNPWTALTDTSSIINENLEYGSNKSAVALAYTSSAGNSGKVVFRWDASKYYTISAGQTVVLGTKFLGMQYISSGGSGGSRPTTHYLTFGIYSGSEALSTNSYTMPLVGGLGYANIYLPYTNTGSIDKIVTVNFVPSMLATSGNSTIYGITVSEMAFATAKAYTEINPYGVLIYASPTNYIKLTTQTSGSNKTSSFGVLAIDKLYVGGVEVPKGGYSSVGGSGSVTDESGTTAEKFTINMDGTNNDSSLALVKGINSGELIYDGTNISSSVPLWSNTTIYSNNVASSIAVGRLPAGATFTNMSVTDILNNILYYDTPTLGDISWSGYNAGVVSSSILYLKVGEVLTDFSASSTVTNYASFNTELALVEGTTPIAWQIKPVSSGAKYISKSSYNMTKTTGTALSYTITASSTLNTPIVTSAKQIRWRQPIYAGYTASTSISNFSEVIIVSEKHSTATTATCGSNHDINSATNAYYYIIYTGSSANMLTGKDQNGANILWLANGGGSTIAPATPSFTITCSNGFQTNSYKVYRTYYAISGLYTFTIT